MFVRVFENKPNLMLKVYEKIFGCWHKLKTGTFSEPNYESAFSFFS